LGTQRFEIDKTRPADKKLSLEGAHKGERTNQYHDEDQSKVVRELLKSLYILQISIKIRRYFIESQKLR